MSPIGHDARQNGGVDLERVEKRLVRQPAGAPRRQIDRRTRKFERVARRKAVDEFAIDQRARQRRQKIGRSGNGEDAGAAGRGNHARYSIIQKPVIPGRTGGASPESKGSPRFFVAGFRARGFATSRNDKELLARSIPCYCRFGLGNRLRRADVHPQPFEPQSGEPAGRRCAVEQHIQRKRARGRIGE